jgi:virulence-associated protein VagC
MTKRVTRKLFKNGGSWAIRIPKGWLPEDGEFDVVVREDGVLEIRTLDRDQRMRRLLQEIKDRGPITEEEFPIPKREPEPERFDWDELWNGKMP